MIHKIYLYNIFKNTKNFTRNNYINTKNLLEINNNIDKKFNISGLIIK